MSESGVAARGVTSSRPAQRDVSALRRTLGVTTICCGGLVFVVAQEFPQLTIIASGCRFRFFVRRFVPCNALMSWYPSNLNGDVGMLSQYVDAFVE